MPARKSLSPNAACLRGQACGRPARAGWPVSGSRGPVLREAADAFVVGPGGAAVLVLLPPAVRRAAAVRGRRTWRAEMAALSRASCWTRLCVLSHPAVAYLLASCRAGPVGRWGAGG